MKSTTLETGGQEYDIKRKSQLIFGKMKIIPRRKISRHEGAYIIVGDVDSHAIIIEQVCYRQIILVDYFVVYWPYTIDKKIFNIGYYLKISILLPN